MRRGLMGRFLKRFFGFLKEININKSFFYLLDIFIFGSDIQNCGGCFIFIKGIKVRWEDGESGKDLSFL